jgi:hypothetical protein
MAYGQDQDDYALGKASTLKSVDKHSNQYVIWDKADYFRDAMQLRANGDKAVRSGQRLSKTTYFTDVYAVETQITDRDRNAAAGEIDIEKQKTRWLTEQGYRKHDILYAAGIFVTGVWTANTQQAGVVSGASSNEFLNWNDSSATPILDIKEQALVVQTSTGKRPNVGMCSQEVFDRLSEHASIRDLYKHTTPGPVSEELVAKALGLDRLFIPRSVKNTAAEGQTASMSQVFANNFLMMYISEAASDEEPTAVTTFAWDQGKGIGSEGVRVSRYREDGTESDILVGEIAVDVKITANDCGVMMLSAIA